MYISLEDRGAVFSILKNWPERRIKVRRPYSKSRHTLRHTVLPACAFCIPGQAAWGRDLGLSTLVAAAEHSQLRTKLPTSARNVTASPAQAICLTDGSRVGTRFDMGVQVWLAIAVVILLAVAAWAQSGARLRA